MSAELSSEMPIENTVVSTETAGTVKKPRVKKPVLAVKLLKYLDFGFQVVQNLHSAGLLDDEGLDLAFAQIKLLSSVEDQTAFYSNFLDQSNDTAKILRKFVAAKLKPVPVKKPRAKKAAKTDTNTDTTHPSDQAKTPPKAPRATKSKKTTRTVADADDDIIGALAQAARGEPCREPTGREPTDCIVQQAVLRPLPSDDTTYNTTEPVSDTKTKKPRKKPEPKATVAPLPQPTITDEHYALQGVVGGRQSPTELPVELATPITPVVATETTDIKTKKTRKKPEPKAKVATEVTPTELTLELATPITPVVATETISDIKTKKNRKKPEPKAKVTTEVTPTELTLELATPTTDDHYALQGVVGGRQSPTTDDHIHATEITIDNRLLLIDQHNQLYDPISFILIGHFISPNSFTFI